MENKNPIDLSKLGTPKTLDEALTRFICFRPPYSIQRYSYEVTKDFLAQKFQVAIFKAESEETKEAIAELFLACVAKSADFEKQLQNRVGLGQSKSTQKEAVNSENEEK